MAREEVPLIADVLLPLPRQARIAGGRPALVVDGETVSYAALHSAADGVARRLAGLRVGAGDRVAACLVDGRRTAELLHAVARLGAVLVPLNWRLTPPELTWQLSDAEPTVAVWDPAMADRIPGDVGGAIVVASRASRAGESDVGPVLGDLPTVDVGLRDRGTIDQPYTLVYTSGTAGRPRGAVLTLGNHLWSALGSAIRLGTQPGDRWLAPMPLFHVGGLSILARAAVYGTTVEVAPRFEADDVVRRLRRGGVTQVSLVPTMLLRVLEAWDGGPSPVGLRTVLLGGAHAPPELVARAEAAGLPIAPTYGLTEACSQVATATPGGPPDRPMPPMPFTELRVVDGAGADVLPGAEGEILVRGPTVMAGYWRAPEVTASALEGGWLHTRDLGRLDDRGHLTCVGRRSDLIVTGGENVHPLEVEAVLDQHPLVAESCVVGVPDPVWGAVVVAVVVPEAGAARDAECLDAYVRAHLAGYKVPRRYVWRDAALPRNAGGKVLRSEVAAEVTEAWRGARTE